MLQPKQIPTTGRKANFHVRQFGFKSLEDFAASLPKNAVVADVGAGLSRLGHRIAELRADIRWVNIDPCYKDKGILQSASKNLPANVTLYDGDIVDGIRPPKDLKRGADIVFSYWLLPHLSLENDEPAKKACKHMLALPKPDGRLVVGPVRHWGLGILSPYRYKGTVSHSKKENPDKVVADIVSKTKLWWLGRMVQLFSNRHQIHLASKLVGGKSGQITFRRASDGHAFTFLCCADLCCSLHVRNLTQEATLSRTQLHEDITSEQRIARLKDKLGRVLTTLGEQPVKTPDYLHR